MKAGTLPLLGIRVLAHAHEQAGRKERNKGPTPPHYLWTYGGDNPIK